MSKQYILQLHSGYVESQSIASLVLYRLYDKWDQDTPEQILRDFRSSMKSVLPTINEGLAYYKQKPFTAGELFEHMLSADCDSVGEVYELLEEEGWNFNPSNVYFAGAITADRVEIFLDHKDDTWLPYVDLYQMPKHEVKPSPLTDEERAFVDELLVDEDDET